MSSFETFPISRNLQKFLDRSESSTVRDLRIVDQGLTTTAVISAEQTPTWLVLDGTAGTSASTPDSAPLDITGDIDVRIKVLMDDWTPTSDQCFISKFNTTGNQRSWRFVLNPTTGFPHFAWSTDGSSVLELVSTSAFGFSDGTPHWVRVTLNTSSGDVSFYKSDDSTNNHNSVSWTLHETVSGAGATSIFNSNADLIVGTLDGGTIPLAGSIYAAAVLDGTTVVANPIFTSDAQGWEFGDSAGATGTDGKGNVFTLNGNAEIQRQEASR